MNEERILAAIARVLGGPPSPSGIGDDAAVLAPFAGAPVVTVDAAVEGVHFTRALLSLEDVGYRATMAAASDLAAMGASPRALLAAITAPRDTPIEDFVALATGQRAAADALGTAIVGGNLARGGLLSLTTTAIGETRAPLLRRGARVGDRVGLLGPIGLSAAGLRLLLARGDDATRTGPDDYPDTYTCIEAFRRPTARFGEAALLEGIATSALDVSDGLAIDGARLGQASGVRLVLSARAVESAGGAALWAAAGVLGTTALALALEGGEDYALLFTAVELPRGARAIGHVDDGPPGLVVLDGAGVAVTLPDGFAHFGGGQLHAPGSEPPFIWPRSVPMTDARLAWPRRIESTSPLQTAAAALYFGLSPGEALLSSPFSAEQHAATAFASAV